MVKRLKEKVRPTVKANFDEFFKGYVASVNRRVEEAEQAAEAMEKDISFYAERLEEWEINIKNDEDTKKRLQEERKQLRDVAKELKKNGEEQLTADRENVEGQFGRLMQHVGIETINYDGELHIQTKLLFANVSEDEDDATAYEDGEDIKASRICLGAFDVRINPTKNLVKIENKLFDGHWGFGFGRNVCLGEYEADFNERCTKGDWYGAYDLIYHYIQSYEDRGAYIHPWRWRTEYHNLTNYPIGDGIKIGDRVIWIGGTYEGNRLNGYIGKVVAENGPNLWVVEFFEPLPPEKQNGRNDWVVPKGNRYVIKMPDGVYPEAKILSENDISTVIHMLRTIDRRDEALQKIDALPNLASLEEAMKIINSYK